MKTEIVRSQQALALRLGVSRQSISAWFRWGCPRGEAGTYDVDEVKAWRERNLRPARGGRPVEYSPAAMHAKVVRQEARVTHAQARLAAALDRWRQQHDRQRRRSRRARKAAIVNPTRPG